LREYNKEIFAKNVQKSFSTSSIESPYLFMDANTNRLITLRYLVILIKLELIKMGVSPDKFSVYSIKHSAISYLVKQKVDF
jgi:site-specific recombinase XerD